MFYLRDPFPLVFSFKQNTPDIPIKIKLLLCLGIVFSNYFFVSFLTHIHIKRQKKLRPYISNKIFILMNQLILLSLERASSKKN